MVAKPYTRHLSPAETKLRLKFILPRNRITKIADEPNFPRRGRGEEFRDCISV